MEKVAEIQTSVAAMAVAMLTVVVLATSVGFNSCCSSSSRLVVAVATVVVLQYKYLAGLVA